MTGTVNIGVGLLEPQTITRIDFWRDMNGWNYEELGEQLGVSQQAAWRYCQLPGHKYHRRPAHGIAVKLRQLSNGKVTAGNCSDVLTIEAEAA